MSKHSRLEALRALAERPGTEAEGIVAREILARLESRKESDKPEDERGIWAAFESMLRGEIDPIQFSDKLRGWPDTVPTHWTCPCGTVVTVGLKCVNSEAHRSVQDVIRFKFKKGDRVVYNFWAYPKDSLATVVGYCERGKPDGHSYPWAWIRLKFDHLKNAQAVPIYKDGTCRLTVLGAIHG